MIAQWMAAKDKIQKLAEDANSKHDYVSCYTFKRALSVIQQIETEFEIQSLKDAGYGV